MLTLDEIHICGVFLLIIRLDFNMSVNLITV